MCKLSQPGASNGSNEVLFLYSWPQNKYSYILGSPRDSRTAGFYLPFPTFTHRRTAIQGHGGARHAASQQVPLPRASKRGQLYLKDILYVPHLGTISTPNLSRLGCRFQGNLRKISSKLWGSKNPEVCLVAILQGPT